MSAQVRLESALYDRQREEIASNVRKPTSDEMIKFYDALLQLVLQAGVSFSLLEAPCLKRLCHFLNENLPVPPIAILQNRLYEIIREQKEHIKGYLISLPCQISLTLDDWERPEEIFQSLEDIENSEETRFLCIRGHFFSPSFNAISLILSMEHVRGYQEASDIKDTLDGVIRDWGLQGRISAVTTGQGRNIQKAVDLYSKDISHIPWVHCTSHKTELCITNSIEQDSAVMAIFRKCRDITHYISGSTSLSELFTVEQQKNYYSTWELFTLDVDPWNSWFTMAARVHMAYPKLLRLIQDLKRKKSGDLEEDLRYYLKKDAEALERFRMDDDEFLALEEMISLLQPVVNFMNWARTSASRLTLSQVYTHVYTVLLPIRTVETTQAQALHTSLEAQLRESWPLSEISDHELLAIYLNPACAASDFMKTTTVEDPKAAEGFITLEQSAMNLLRDKIQQRMADKPCSEIMTMETMDEGDEQPENVATLAYQALYSSEMDVEKYVVHPQEFWCTYQDDPSFAEVIPIALSYLGIQATSTADPAFSNDESSSDENDGPEPELDDNFPAVVCAKNYSVVISQIAQMEYEVDHEPTAQPDKRRRGEPVV
ncbi:hypothetical protein EMPS_05863 [Entomortierella parvispora]|uniref:DUF659 domain-containing protein n=1 Tax=Entomortierella parvispora TaxID=205924 RepID=A0A9P3HBJ8_9FUNG|nr:hypothetical protein EMPS_05863 [Entomortierella parvispora]